ncbi:hypothetical protein H632_c775p0, partial [Helicosporidium sp. ATCC 50920]
MSARKRKLDIDGEPPAPPPPEASTSGDASSSGLNPYTGRAYSDRYRAILATRTTLPVWQARGDLLAMLAAHQSVILVGETGSGKTTQVAQFVADAGYCRDGRQVACTQPRRVAAMSVA